MQDELLTIQEAATFYGVSPRTLRRWEEKGYLKPQRTLGNQRRYSKEQLSMLVRSTKLEEKIIEEKELSQEQPALAVSQPANASPFHLVFISAISFVVVLALAVFLLPHDLAGMHLGLKKPNAQQNVVGSGVLSAETHSPQYVLRIDVPGIFSKKVSFLDDVAIRKGLTVEKVSKLNGGVVTNNADIDAGTGKITASNVIYSIIAGSNVAISGDPQNPVISTTAPTAVSSLQGQTGALSLSNGSGISLSGLQITNTGVLSVQGQSGSVAFTQGAGITLSGLTITNSDPGSSQKIFGTFSVNGTDITAGSNTDTLTFAAGSGVTLTPDATNKKITIDTSPAAASQWTTSGTDIYYTLGNVGIGTTTPGATLDVSGTGRISGAVTFSSLGVGIVHSDGTGLLSSSALNLESEVSGVLPVVNGGTGLSTVPGNGKILIGNGTNYTLGNLTGTANQIIISNGAGSITFATPQDIDQASAPTFSALTLSNNTNQLTLGTGTTGVLSMDALTTNRTYTLPDSSGTFCLSSGNCGSGGGGGTIVGSGTTNYITKFTSSTGISDSSIYDNGRVGIGTTSPQGLLDISGSLAGRALVNFNQNSGADIFTASASGATRLVLTNSGNLNIIGGDYHIGGVSVLSGTTLGSGVVNSSLSGVGVLSSGSITSSFGNIDVGNDSISGGDITAAGPNGFIASGADADLIFSSIGNHDIVASAGTLGLGAATLLGDLTGNGQNITGVNNFSAGGTVTFGSLGTGVVQSNGSGVLSSGALNLAGGTSYVSGVLPVANGGTGLSSYATGALIYASGANTLGALPIGTDGQVLTVSGNVPTWSSASSFSYWQRLSGAVSPLNISDDLLIGGAATSSAKFQIYGNTGNASTSGNLTFNGASSIQTTRNQTLTIGGSSTGNIVLSPNNGNGTVTATGNLNLASGKAYQINGTSVLNATTLGSGVTTSSLTTVGALASGSIANGFGTINSGNTITGTDINATNGIRTGAGAGTIRLSDTGNLVNIGTTQFNGITYAWPGADGSGDYVLTTDGIGGLTWKNVTSVGGAGDITGIGDVTTGDAFTAGGTQGTSLYFYDADGRGQLTIGNLTAPRTYSLPDSSGTICLTSGNCAGAGGGITGTGTSGQLAYFNGTGSITSETTGFSWDSTNKRFGIGTDTPAGKFTVSGANTGKALVVLNETGNQDILTASASGTMVFNLTRSGDVAIEGQLSDISQNAVTVNDALNLVSGNTYQINGTNVLSASTLGVGVTTSSLTTVGALSSGSIANGFGTILTGNTIQGTDITASGTTGFTGTGVGAGLTFSGSGNHVVNASSGTLLLGAATLNGAITGNSQNVTGLNNLSAGGTITFGGLTTGIVKSNGSGVLSSSAIGLGSADVTGTLGVLNGGTGITSVGSAGSVAYSNGTAYAFTAIGSNGQVLVSNGSGTPTWADAAGVGTNYWQRNGGVVAPVNITDDLVVGGSATSSAKFQVFGLTGNASTSGNLTFDTAGAIQTTKKQTLTVGGNTTGNIQLSPNNNAGYVGINTTPASAALSVRQGSGLDNMLSIQNTGGAEALNISNIGYTVFKPTGGDGVAFKVQDSTGVFNKFTVNTAYSAVGINTAAFTSTAADPALSIFTSANDQVGLRVSPNGAGQTADLLQLNNSSAVTLAKFDVTGKLGIGAGSNSLLGTADIRALSGTLPVASISGSTSNASLLVDQSGVGDLFTANKSGATKFAILNTGDVRIANLSTNGGLLYANGTGTVAQTTAGTNGQCLISNGGGAPTWGSCNGGAAQNYWQLNNGAISPFTASADLLIGGTSTASAKFAFINNAVGTPTASISAGLAGAAYLTATGSLQTTAFQTLTLGGNTTGNIVLTPRNGNGSVSISNLTNCDTIDTDANGTLVCGSDAGGSGSAGIINVQNNGVGVGSSVDTLNFGSQFSVTASPATKANIAIANDILNFSEFSDTLSLDAATSVALSNFDFTLGTNAGNGGVIVSPNAGGNAALIVNKQGANDIFTASAAGATKFTIANNGAVTLNNYTTNGGLLYTNGTGTVAQTAAGLNGQCLLSSGGGAPTWGSCGASSNYWQLNNGALSPFSTTADLLLGGTATNSAKFSVLNMTGAGTPTASVSATSTGTGVSLGGDGSIQSLRNNTLTIGGNTTGDINFRPGNSSSSLYLGSNGSVGVGTTNLNSGKFNVSGTYANVTDGYAGITIDPTFSLSGNSGNTYRGAYMQGLFGDSFNLGGLEGSSSFGSFYGTGTLTNLKGAFAQGGISTGATGTVTNLWGVNGDAHHGGTGTVSDAVGVEGTVNLAASGTGNDGEITRAYGVRGSVANNLSANTGTIATGYALYAASPVASANAPITTNYGVYVNNQGSTGITTATGLFVAAQSGASTNYSAIFAGGRVGIGTLTPGGTLEIAGNGLNAGTTPVTKISGTTANAGLVVDNAGVGDLFTASKSGTAKFTVLNNGDVQITNLTTNGGLLYTNGTGTVAQTTAGSNGQCLLSSGGGAPTWGSCNSGAAQNYWQLNNGAISPFTTSADLLIGGTSTASAKFAFINNASGTPTASVSAGAAGATYLTATGILQTTAFQTLTLGGNTTGNIVLDSGNGVISLADNTTVSGNVTATGTTGLTASGNGAGLTFSGTGTHAVTASAGTLQLGAVTLGGAVTGGGQNLTGLGNLSNSGTVQFSNMTTNGGLLYTDGTGTVAQSTAGSAGQILQSNGSGAPTWVNASTVGTNYFQKISGALSPITATDDLLLGSNATVSAKFAFLNNAGGTPTASISANSGNNATYITGTGTLATTNKQTLTIGSASTGNIVLNGFGTGVVKSNASGVLSSSAISLANGSADITGTLSVANGGTGATTLTQGGVLYGNAASAIAASAQGTTGQALLSGGSGAPTWTTGTLTLAGNFATSGSSALTLTTTGATNVTLPTTGTLATLAGAETFSNKTLTAPKIANGGFIADANGNEQLIFTTTASAVNEITLGNASTTTSPTITASGGDTNVGLTINGKGNGAININNTGTGNILLGGGLGATGCTLTNSSGAFACDSTITGSNISGTNTGDQTITLTGDVTGSGTGSFATTIAANTVDGTMIDLGGGSAGDMMYYNGTDWIALGAGSTTQVLHSGATPSWGGVSLTTDVSGTLPIANGGTNSSATPTNGGIAYGTGTAYAFTTAGTNGQCLLSNGAAAPAWGACPGGGATQNYWQLNNGAISPYVASLDVLFGSTATSSAKFSVLNMGSGTPTASVSATSTGNGLSLAGDGTIQSLRNNTLTIGGNTTGNITLSPLNGSGKVTSTGTLNLASGKTYQINGTDVLSASTLGSGVTGSSLQGVGVLSAGSITGGFGSIDVGSDSISGGDIISTGTTGYTSSGTGAGLTFSGTSTHTISASTGTLQLGAATLTGAITGNTQSITGLGQLTVDNLRMDANTIDTTSGDLTLNAAGGDIIFSDATTLNIGGNASDVAYNVIGDSISSADSNVNSDDDLYIEGNLETTGNIYAQTITSGSVVFAGASGLLTQDNNNFFFDSTNKRLGIGNKTPLAALDVRGTSGTTPVASVAGITSNASLIVDNAGVGDLFTASKSGATKFTIKNSGVVVIGNSTNGITFDPLNGGPTYTGTARPTKTISLMPEYAGAALTAFNGSATDTLINGQLTSDVETSSTNNLRNYYQWTSSQGSLNYYTVAVRVRLPKDFAGWATTNALQIDYATSSTSTANNVVDARIYLESNSTTAVTTDTSNVSGTANVWTNITFDDSVLDDGSAPVWNGADQVATIFLRVGALGSNTARLGEIKLNYLSSF